MTMWSETGPQCAVPYPDGFGPEVTMKVVQVTRCGFDTTDDRIATEIPLTIIANDIEVATLLASPSNLKELTYGYLFTSGYIGGAGDVAAYVCDERTWTAYVDLEHMPDPSIMRKRLYTSGCGRYAMYTTVNEVSLRKKMDNPLHISRHRVFDTAKRLHEGTELFRSTGSVHCSLLINISTGIEILMDDVARHNSLDKAAGRALLDQIDLSDCILARTGRTSSEMVYKARRCGISISIARGAPTHQAVHLAQEMGITLIGFARPDGFTIYAGSERIEP